ncbi:Retinol dehydrogenase 14 [Holothuria leucospilota]|uniref:Retinol dehydrogenase 14 n=1 Tax=Holothuria leucospilota TaxID=206669 RepID=A0A9Q1BRV5_HOLLE|nr:Retinol dehydrogenase 14 [Holothuria leucospilota]
MLGQLETMKYTLHAFNNCRDSTLHSFMYQLAESTLKLVVSDRSMVTVAKGAKVILACNIDISDGLVNEEACVVIGFILSDDYVHKVMVKYDNESVGHLAQQQGPYSTAYPSTIPFPRIEALCVGTRKSIQLSWKQFTLNLAWACTIYKVITEDGYEIHFQVNYLSHLLLTLHLLPLIKQSGPNSRIVNISSIGHFFSEVNLDNIQSQQHFNGIKCYGKSKLYQIMSMYQLAKRLDKDTVSVFSVHPGFVQTNLLNSETTFINRLFIGAFVALGLSRKPVDGAIGPLIAALDPGFNGQTALYLSGERPTNPYAIARDEAKQEIIWNYSLECLKKYLNDEILGEIGIKMDDIKTVKHSVGECEGTDVDKMEGNVDKEEGHVDKKGLL